MGKTRDTANLTSDNNITVDIVNDRVGIGSTIPAGQLNVRTGPVIIGAATSTGTASQNLQVTGGAYVSGNVGMGSTNPQEKLDIQGGNGFIRIGEVFGGYNGITLNNSTTDANYNILSSPSDATLYLNRPATGGSIRFHYGNNSQMSLNASGALIINNGISETGTTSQLLQVTGGAYVSGSVGIGTTRPTSTLHVVGGDSDFEGVIETVGTATTYMVSSAMVLEMDVRRATVYTYTIPTGANIGIVSFRNMPAQTGSATGSTVTLLVTQNSAGTANTTAATGIGTNCTVIGYENGASVAGISTRGLVGSATTVTLSTTGNDVDFVSFFINYNGGTNTTASSYKVYVTKNGGFRQGTIGV